MRYDRYDTCLHVCLRGPRPLRANASRIATNRRRAEISARRSVIRARIIFHERAKVRAHGANQHANGTNFNGLSRAAKKR